MPMTVGIVAAQPAPDPAPVPVPVPRLLAAADEEWRQYAESLRDWSRQWRDWSKELRLAQQPHPAPPPGAPQPPPEFRFSSASRSFLGVQVVEVDGERARALKLKDEVGVEITSVDPESPAEKAGLKRGDVVLEYQGQRVEGTEQFIRLVRETPAGRQVKLSVARNGATQLLNARIESRKSRVFRAGDLLGEGMPPALPRGEMWFPDAPRAITGWRNPRLGVEAESLSGQLAAFFGVKEGVLVRSVTKGSAAEAAGFKAGDVITKVDQKALNSASELSSLLRSARGRKTLPVTVVREKREMTLTVALAEETGSATPPAPPDRPGPAVAPPALPAPPAPARSINRRDEF